LGIIDIDFSEAELFMSRGRNKPYISIMGWGYKLLFPPSDLSPFFITRNAPRWCFWPCAQI